MTFLSLPFLLAGLAAAIPLMLHMISRQKATELPFSTLRFLQISVEKTRRRKRFHDLLLMAVRMAVLILIAFGLARPTLTHLSALWGGGTATAVAIVLDNSASMGLIDQGRVRFRTALHAAEQILGELHEGDQVALLLTDGPKFPEAGHLDRTHEKVRQLLNQWIDAPSDTEGVSYERADLDAKIRQAQRLLADSDAASKHLYVLTDLQQVSLAAEQSRDGSAVADVPIIVVDCHQVPKPNVAIDGVDLEAALPVAGQPILAKVELFNAAPVAQQRHLELYVDGAQKYTSAALEIPPGGRLEHDAQFVCDRSGLCRGEVRLAGEDGSRLDDRRFFALEIDQGIPVAVVKPQRHEIPYLEDTFYVEQALAPGAAGDWAIRTTALTADELPTRQLAGFKVIFCVNLPALADETARQLAAYVAGGGNLVWIGGDHVDPDAYNRMNEEAGRGLLPVPLLDVRAPAAGGDRDSWQIGFLDKEHPALSDLVEPASLYQSVLIYKHLRLDVDEAAGVRVLARLDDGEPLLVQRSIGRGKVLLLGTGAHVGWSNLPLRPIFLPLLVRLTFDLAGAEQTRDQVLAGSPLVLPLDDAPRPPRVEVRLPNGETIRPEIAPAEGAPPESFRYDDTHQIGVYQLGLIGAKPRAFAVNVDPTEADPAKVGREALQSHFGATPLVFAEDPADLTDTFQWLREGQSLWELFLLAVLIALVFETFLANRLSPKQEQSQTTQPPPGLRRLARRGAA
ncbi:MAG: BatA domain-containing protein [Pirellulales bacterium]|nr:BatA domain-containing protein [Pirellulales bacterium]